MAVTVSEQENLAILSESDIPGAYLRESMDQHVKPELIWWLLCCGIKDPTSFTKKLSGEVI